MNIETLVRDKCAVVIYGGPTYNYSPDGSVMWKVSVKKESNGTKLEVEGTGSTLPDACADAAAKFSLYINAGIKEFQGALLEHQPEVEDAHFEPVFPDTPKESDEIPF